MNILKTLIVLTGVAPYVLLSVSILKGTVKQSFATWILWFGLDVIMLVSLTLKGGNTLLFAVFTIGTLAVTIFLARARQFHWGKFEWLITFLVLICTTVFLVGGPYLSIISVTLALNIAGIPQLISTYKDPSSTPRIAYLLFTTSSMLSVISAAAWTVEERLPYLSSTLFCAIIVLLSFRQK